MILNCSSLHKSISCLHTILTHEQRFPFKVYYIYIILSIGLLFFVTKTYICYTLLAFVISSCNFYHCKKKRKYIVNILFKKYPFTKRRYLFWFPTLSTCDLLPQICNTKSDCWSITPLTNVHFKTENLNVHSLIRKLSFECLFANNNRVSLLWLF